ncbi:MULTISPECIES: acyl-homoserine-lactone synthase [unclassified Chelatococcus]|uniref:acyl-homoserine-lactone synthase n=1 Tax=unclassified Chelatococcus TaxID=2638111 RepID=UPI0002E7D428|nr:MULTISPECIES: acyl-homoserine-lactone synthase [unclassified Chelatococcus]ALA18509.1 autoinducer synthesis protein [Chelatococcus sp. CO-6]
MFRIHAVSGDNQACFADQLEQYFRIRHEIYVGERGWSDVARPDGREIDQFDTDSAIHLLGMHPSLGLVAGSRLVPTLAPHLLSDVFPQLAPNGIPRAEDAFEWTRIFVVPALREPGRPSRAAGMVYCGILEFCLSRGIRRLSVVCETYWLPRLANLGWRPQRLGPAIWHKGEEIMGLILDMTEDALMRTRAFYGITRPVLATKAPACPAARLERGAC